MPQEYLAVPLRGGLVNLLLQRLMPGTALIQFHRERSVDRLGDFVRVERIDDQRLGQFVRGAGETRQYQDARIQCVLRGDEFLRDQIHSIPQWRDDPDACDAIEPRQRAPAQRAGDVTQWDPIEFRVPPIDITRDTIQLTTKLLVVTVIFSGAGRDLEKAHSTAVVWIGGQ